MPTSNKASDQLKKKLIATIKSVPRGCVASYGQIAEMAGYPGRARMVGRILRESDGDLPWHRILKSDRSSAFPADSELHKVQMARLQDEGVLFQSGRAPKKAFEWSPDLDEFLWGPIADR